LGLAIDTIVSSGGKEVVSHGGITSNTVVESGGREGVGGVTNGTVVHGGGLEVVASGGVASGTLIDGGTLRIRSGGLIGSTTFAPNAGGLIRFDSSLTFRGGLVAGFGQSDQLDLFDLAFTSSVHATWNQATTSRGRLAVTDGIHTAHFTLLGQYVAGNFHVSTDGHGGTLVTEQPVSASSIALVNPHQT
jgi:autotransporter passenger strand-loop-strand repeat protein